MPAIIADNSGKILRASAGLRELTGYCSRELSRMPLGLIAGDGRPFPEGVSETWLFTKDGGKVLVRACASSSSGAVLIIFHPLEREKELADSLVAARAELTTRQRYLEDFREGVFRMISDLDRSESELKGALQKLSETQMQLMQSSKMTALGELAASLAHEVAQPLTVIRGVSQGMLRSMTAGEAGALAFEKVNLISEAARKMEAIVKHLRVFTRVTPPAFEPVDLNSVVRDAFLILKEMLIAHSIDTVIDLAPVPGIAGNQTRLEQVIINLVTNARDAMPDGGVLKVMSLTSERDGKRYAVLTVEDTGTGIPREIIDRIFDPFVTTKEAGKGTGLGLSITAGIVKEHRGYIKVESDPHGTAFHVFIPALEKC